jgi:hypothetical protein
MWAGPWEGLAQRGIWGTAADFVATKIRSLPRNWSVEMARGAFSLAFKIEAVRLVTDRGVAVAQAA